MPIKAIVNGVEKEITRIPVLGHDIETATGTNSITFNTSSDRIIEYDILGNTQQTGTPAPDAPIMPQFVGVNDGGNWKIPITCAGQTVLVYLGQTQTVRRIKKLVLTGDENWVDRPQYTKADRFVLGYGGFIKNYSGYCTHYEVTDTLVNTYPSLTLNDGTQIVINHCAKGTTTLADFKQFLRDQYSSGTPVTIWYVSTNEQTIITNEPLAKIGTYADELHSTDAGVTIPTAKGQNTLTVDTTLSPSQTTVKYRGTSSIYKNAWEVRDNQDRLLWYREDTLTGTSSITYKGYGIPLKSIKIDGNTQQTGTPAPDAPIMPELVGERTANLFDGVLEKGVWDTVNTLTQTTSDVFRSFKRNTPAGTYTISFENPVKIVRLIEDGTVLVDVATNVTSYTITSTIDGDIGFSFRLAESSSALWDNSNIMFNTGSTVKPYEPYGYKIPITCAGQTVPIYLGQTQTVRRIKKLVLTGKEAGWAKSSNYTFYLRVNDYLAIKSITCMSSHYVAQTNVTTGDPIGSGHCCFYGESGARIFYVKNIVSYPTVSDFKSYLAAQYAAGTPVTVWYILATPETAIINEPLAKIGDYADELTTNPNITPQTGTNTLTVDTTLSPSSVSITGHIKQE